MQGSSVHRVVAVQGMEMVLQDGVIVVRGKASGWQVVVQGDRVTRTVLDKGLVVRGMAILTIHRAGPARMVAAVVVDVHNLDPADSAVRGSLRVVAEEVYCKNLRVEECMAGRVEQVSRRTEDMLDIPVGTDRVQT